MQWTRIAKGSGFKLVIGNNIFSQYWNEKWYVKCDICSGIGHIENDIATPWHVSRNSASAADRKVSQACSREASRIFAIAANFWYSVTVCTVCWKCSCFDCRVWWNRKLHKRRRRLLPLLPTDACAVAAQEHVHGSETTSNGGTARIFASDSQLHLLSALTAPYAEVQYLLLSTIIIRSET